MGFQKGVPRHPNAGRKKGSKNIKRVAKVSELLAQRDKNPAEEILKLIETGNLNDKEKVDCWLDLLSYCQPKPKAVEVEDDDPDELDVFDNLTDEQLLKIVNSDEAM